MMKQKNLAGKMAMRMAMVVLLLVLSSCLMFALTETAFTLDMVGNIIYDVTKKEDITPPKLVCESVTMSNYWQSSSFHSMKPDSLQYNVFKKPATDSTVLYYMVMEPKAGYTFIGTDITDDTLKKWFPSAKTVLTIQSTNGYQLRFTISYDGTDHTHTYEGGYAHDDSNHWKICTICQRQANKSAHEWGEWVTDKQPTANEPGSRHRDCNVCGMQGTEPIPPIGEPTAEPTSTPTENPTSQPTAEPTGASTENPTSQPTTAPTVAPSAVTASPKTADDASALFWMATMIVDWQHYAAPSLCAKSSRNKVLQAKPAHNAGE